VSKTDIIVTGKGQTLFFDPLSHRYFYSSIEKIRRAENKLNKEINTDPFGAGRTINDFYDEIGIPNTATGDALGWNLNVGLIDIYLSYQGGDEGTEYEDVPCAVINFHNPPRYEFL
jgi:hypothetical protein